MSNALSAFSSIVKENQSLAPHTWLQIGGPTRYLVEPNTVEELCQITSICNSEGIAIRTLGGGSNLLVRESGFNGATILMTAPAFQSIHRSENTVIAGGGVKLSHLITFCVGAGLGGIEHLVAIPGTVGGAVRGNAGTDDGEIGNTVSYASVLGKDGTIRQLECEKLALTHRASGLDGIVIIDVAFKLIPGDSAMLTKREQTFWILKRRSQPSFPERAAIAFVDPAGYSAADLIEKSGMHGTTQGAVRLSSTFPNYIIASAGATSSNVMELLDRVRNAVQDRCGVQLQQHLQIW